MKKHKKFDCVQMKWDIQEKIAKEAMGISAKEFNKIQMEKIAKNPILEQFLNKVYAATKRKEVQKSIYRPNRSLLFSSLKFCKGRFI